MVTHTEISIIMDGIVNKAMKFMKKSGNLYPTLYLFKKGSSIEIDSTSEEGKDLIEQQAGVAAGDIYLTMEILNNASQEAGNLYRIVKKIVNKYEPDAIGIVLVALYKELPKKEYEKLADKSLRLDPEVIRVIHSSYYIKGDKIPGIRVIPFMDRTGGETDSDEDEVLGILEEDKPMRDIHFVYTPWLINQTKVDPCIKNPF